MSKVFYDRTGRAHTIGNPVKKGQGKSEERSRSPFEKSAASKSHSKSKRSDQRSDSPKSTSPWERKPRSEGKRDFARSDRPESSRDARGGFGRKDSKRERSHAGGRSRGGPDRGRPSPRPRAPVTPNPDWIRLKGVIDKNKRGSAFLVFDRADLEDVFIPRYYVEQLFHGDRVEVFVNDEGEIEDLKVLEHRFKEIFGRVFLGDGHEFGQEFKKSKNTARTGHLVYERKKAKEEVYLPTVPVEVKDGDWVRAEMVFGDNGVTTAKIAEHIGPMLPASYDIQMVAGEFNLKEHHTFDAVKQAEGYTLEIPGKDEIGRTDLRNIPFFTIDGERARDFDDAVYVEKLEHHGYRLWVAIADVSHYVKAGTPLDNEAYARATSVYFPERAFHMLPRALSEELCSLKPHVPRLSMACSIDYTKDGQKGEVRLYDAIIESRRRATYTEIEAEKDEARHQDLFDLYRILKKARHERGSIDFDFPESEIILDEKTGEPSDIVVRERNDAHRLIEEFMIAANESVTEWMLARKLPFVYRIHEEPSPESIEKFRRLSKNMGVAIAGKGGVPRPHVMSEFVRSLKNHPAEPVLATALLRSMRQAIYSASHGEHYGLASEGYTHFTSPIRRYPDLIVHRLLRAALHRENEKKAHPNAKEQEAEQERLNEMAEHCSYRERVASDAERESIRFKQIRMMAKNIGNEFEGKVNGLTEKGMFIQLWHPYCEGMVTTAGMKDDWYEFNEERMILFGRKKRKTFTIGMKVKIQVVAVDLDARTVEFRLIES
jgi:ribonuclease R